MSRDLSDITKSNTLLFDIGLRIPTAVLASGETVYGWRVFQINHPLSLMWLIDPDDESPSPHLAVSIPLNSKETA